MLLNILQSQGSPNAERYLVQSDNRPLLRSPDGKQDSSLWSGEGSSHFTKQEPSDDHAG